MIFGCEKLRVSFEKMARGDDALGHAYLFYGDAQVGKALFAAHLASLVERGIFELSQEPLLDMARFVPNEKGSLGIDEVRALKRFLWQTPASSPRRIAIVDGAQALTPEAQGALLKIVEEPPTHGLLILIAQDAQALSAPLLSRVSKVYFRRLSDKSLAGFLVKEKKLTAEKAEMLAAKSFGRIGRALNSIEGGEVPVDDIAISIESRIISLREKGVVANSKKIAWLLDRLALVSQFNVNTPLQKKAVEYKG